MKVEKAPEVEILNLKGEFGRLDVENDEFPRKIFKHIGVLDDFN